MAFAEYTYKQRQKQEIEKSAPINLRDADLER
jgi:hypothetical protein